MTATLLEQVRALGLPLGSCYQKQTVDKIDGGKQTSQLFIGWTTDRDKAEAAKALGATIQHYTSRDPEFNGWDVSVREVIDGTGGDDPEGGRPRADVSAGGAGVQPDAGREAGVASARPPWAVERPA